MIAQRIKHRDKVTIANGESGEGKHTPEFVSRIFDEELERIIGELPEEVRETEAEKYSEARRITEEMIRNEQFDPI